ncbi:MAG TPA: type VII secretion protein EccB, partial [Micromonosporaceae bacterium]
MASRSDQVQSHRFAVRRVVTALVTGDADAGAAPAGRSAAFVASVMVAALGLAAVALIGLLAPGADDSWRDGGSVLVEEETGAKFIYRDGVLYPVLNYSSALLLLGTGTPARTVVSRAALADIPRGAVLGIPGAPDLLPGPAQLVTQSWTLCSRPADPVAGGGAPVRAE